MKSIISFTLLLTGLLNAGPIVEVLPTSGTTTLIFSREFLTGVAANSFSITTTQTTIDAEAGLRLRANIVASVVDPAKVRYKLAHTGAMVILSGTKKVEISELVLEQFRTTIRFTGLVRVDDKLVGRVPVFDVSITGRPTFGDALFSFTQGSTGPVVMDARATLTKEAADALNSAFSITTFQEKLNVGLLAVRGTYSDIAR